MNFVDFDQSGKRVEGLDQLKQSVATILSTPIGSRVMRRDFGSRIPDLLDKNITPNFLMQFRVAVIEALTKWEPRLRVTRVAADQASDGGLPYRVIVGVDGLYVPTGALVSLEGIKL